ncbi:MAG: hypothetical protein M1834_005580 [Cirrosporium novae-zelandiae]|nr:MAG: hypothetical protein M1834_005580 [Cirrosporium novae-zelandiae]
MYRGTRSSKGCWTCRLRRKKCDEGKPACLACQSRSIQCHGYDNKRPEWMDGASREQAELSRIQSAVKNNKRRHRRSVPRVRRTHAEKERNNDVDDMAVGMDGEEQNTDKMISIAQELQSECNNAMHFNLTLDQSILLPTAPPPARTVEEDISPICSLTPTNLLFNRFGRHREAELLMHYLDYVFTLQWRFHIPSVQSGGRGWLLWLLTTTKPLYHAALSLSALHQHSLLNKDGRTRKSRGFNDTLQELNEHHNRALQELQVCVQNSYGSGGEADKRKQIEVLACGVQLISFELFRGGISEWQMHLDAATALVSTMEESRQTQSHTSSSSSSACSTQNSPTHTTWIEEEAEKDEPDALEETALRFLTGVVLWMDVCACASTGRAPHLLHHHHTLLRSNRIDLQNICGCDSWVLIQIAQTASLNGWKLETQSQNSLSVWDLVERGRVIHQHLADGITQVLQDPHTSPSEPNTTSITTQIRKSITLIYAHAAQVYLHTVISGPSPTLPEIRTSVRSTVSHLQELRHLCSDPQAIRGLVWPVCIAGCMAEEPLKGFFRNLIEEVGQEAREFGNLSTVLRVMEMCWDRRRVSGGMGGIGGEEEGGLWDWRRAMEGLRMRVLLI